MYERAHIIRYFPPQVREEAAGLRQQLAAATATHTALEGRIASMGIVLHDAKVARLGMCPNKQ